MEALRVSVGLEAYAQRDPLVQYKSKASELFQNLLSSMRLAVISRMFTYRPRQAPEAAIGLRRGDGKGLESDLAPETPASEEGILEAGVGGEIPLAESEPEELPDLDDSELEIIEAVSRDAESQQAFSRSQKRRRRRR
jgi:hypothetical protein